MYEPNSGLPNVSCEKGCVVAATLAGHLETLNARMTLMHATMADMRDALVKQNGRVRDLEIQRWKFDGTIGTLSKLATLLLGAAGVGAAVAKLF